jgi:transposase InsO family protein
VYWADAEAASSIHIKARKSRSRPRRSRPKLWTASESTALMPSPSLALKLLLNQCFTVHQSARRRCCRGNARALHADRDPVIPQRLGELTAGELRALVYPYLLRGKTIDRANQVWAADITYIPMRQGFLYLVAIIDWATRRVLSWRLSNTPCARDAACWCSASA